VRRPTNRGRIPTTAAALAALAGAAFLAAASPKTPAAPGNPLDAALEKRAAGKASLDDIEIDVSWQLEQGNRSAHIWGDGVGIWQDSVQFRLSRDQVLSLVKMLADAKIGAMPQPGARAPAPSPKSARSPLRLRGELTVIAGDVRTHRQQLTKGEQSEALSGLAMRILEISEKAAAADGVRASSLQDGLAKVAAGTLAPQTFSATVRRQATSVKEGEAGPEGWLLRIQGRRASDRLMPKGQLPPPPRELELSESDFRKLVQGVQADDPTSLPPNTYAPAYTDVTITVLDRTKNVPARPYLDVTPETHGEKQKSFDRLYELLRAIHETVQSQGAAANAVKPASKR
jgi:hypothetical protein